MTQSATFGAVLGSGATGSQVRTGLNLSDEAAATDHEGSSEPSVTYKFTRWRNDTAKLVRRRKAANSGWEIIENYGATSDPTTGDDSADGYIRGSVWINTSGNKVFLCSSPAAGAAVWVQAGGAGGGVSSVFGRTGGGGDRRRLHRRQDQRRRRQGDHDGGGARGAGLGHPAGQGDHAQRHQLERRQRQHPRHHRRDQGVRPARRDPDVGRLQDRLCRRQDRHRSRLHPVPQAQGPRLLPLVQGSGGDDERRRRR